MALALTAVAVPAAAAPIDAPRLVSRADGRSGAPGNQAAFGPRLSSSGRYVTFWSGATNLGGKTQGLTIPSAYLRDTYRHRTTALSVGVDRVVVSDDSHTLAWTSGGGDLTVREVYVEPRGSRKFRALPDLVDGLGPAAYAQEAHELIGVSGDGARVAFLKSGGSGPTGIVVADLRSRTLIPVTDRPGHAAPNGWMLGEGLSSNGRFVTFTSAADNLVPGDANGAPDAFVADVETGAVSVVDRTAGGTPADRGAEAGAISYDGRYITFSSAAHDLDPAATNGVRQVYMLDQLTGTTIAVSRRAGATGALGNRDAGTSTISGDGRLIAFATAARNVPHRQCSGSNIVLRDVRRFTTRLIRRPGRLSGRCSMTAPALAGGKSRIAFVARGITRRRTAEAYVARMR